MRIPIKDIALDPGLPKYADDNTKSASRHRRRPHDRPVVCSAVNGGPYIALFGRALLTEAQDHGAETIEVDLIACPSDEERGELALAEAYFNGLLNALAMGRAFFDHRQIYDVTQQELSRRISVTPGTIHHYESLVKRLDRSLAERLKAGDLTFKEARSIADLDSHERQREIAAPFIDGVLSSGHVERVVKKAKEYPTLTIKQIMDDAVPAPPAPEPDPEPPPSARPVFDPMEQGSAEAIDSLCLTLSGALRTLPMQTVPEYKRLNLVSSLRTLEGAVKDSIAFLESERRTGPLG